MQFGILSFGDLALDPSTGRRQPVADQLAETIERIRLAEEVGLGFYGLGEHHLDSYSVSSPATVLAAAASVTSTITLASAVTVLSTDDPVRVYQQFATLDQLSRGRAEIIAGRGSFTESFPLFGAELEDYDALYDEKLDLLRLIDAENPVTWSGRFRPALNGAGVFPRSYGAHLKISVGTGGNPQSSINAGLRGLPIVYAVIGGEPERFAPLVDLYRRAGETAGHTDSEVTMSGIGLIADTSQQAKETFYPYWRQTMEAGARARGWTVPSRADYDGYTHQARTILAGSPAEIADRMASVIAVTNPARYALQMDWAGVPHREVMRAIELFGTEVIPQLR
ncbi:LLM class flavin-dependent oxidoreductase [Mycetocola lacteus]|uniref:LLM class flavin-dependent oxidoreductase n=1 Tax=Mycetocola lacteus TaxID=76637 RepID=A0A3L7AXF5_9MICO|nr:LLM class flavin-dependent oxidoreductase [Mycetocola lacteus]